MNTTKPLPEPLRINDSGKYDLRNYTSSKEIAISGALLLSTKHENDLTTTIKIIEKDSHREFDRLMLLAHQNPMEPATTNITIQGKFFDPRKHYLKIEPKKPREEVHFMLYFSEKK
jgi:hypothetical protein